MERRTGGFTNSTNDKGFNSQSPSTQSSQTQSTGQRIDYRDYKVINSGVNSKGNHYCTREYAGASGTGYHYSNQDGSYYYSNPDGTNYHNNGQGASRYTRADGSGWTKQQFAGPGADNMSSTDRGSMMTPSSSATGSEGSSIGNSEGSGNFRQSDHAGDFCGHGSSNEDYSDGYGNSSFGEESDGYGSFGSDNVGYGEDEGY